jgi:hypothetical protein
MRPPLEKNRVQSAELIGIPWRTYCPHGLTHVHIRLERADHLARP